MRTLENRFWEKVNKTESCWLWTASTRGSNNYGRISVKGKSQPAHRISWELHFGKIPCGMQVCHKCDVPTCVNPEHLFLGTQKDNIADRDSKGRRSPKVPKGEENGRAKIKAYEVEEIRTFHAMGVKPRFLARGYNLHPEYITKLAKGLGWSNLHAAIS